MDCVSRMDRRDKREGRWEGWWEGGREGTSVKSDEPDDFSLSPVRNLREHDLRKRSKKGKKREQTNKQKNNKNKRKKMKKKIKNLMVGSEMCSILLVTLITL